MRPKLCRDSAGSWTWSIRFSSRLPLSICGSPSGRPRETLRRDTGWTFPDRVHDPGQSLTTVRRGGMGKKVAALAVLAALTRLALVRWTHFAHFLHPELPVARTTDSAHSHRQTPFPNFTHPPRRTGVTR